MPLFWTAQCAKSTREPASTSHNSVRQSRVTTTDDDCSPTWRCDAQSPLRRPVAAAAAAVDKYGQFLLTDAAARRRLACRSVPSNAEQLNLALIWGERVVLRPTHGRDVATVSCFRQFTHWNDEINNKLSTRKLLNHSPDTFYRASVQQRWGAMLIYQFCPFVCPSVTFR